MLQERHVRYTFGSQLLVAATTSVSETVTHRTVDAWQAKRAYIVKVITSAVTQLQT